MSKKQNFLQGAALLAIATAIVKVIGAFYKLPLKAIIGDIGYGYFNTAYEIYTLLMMVATAGLPVAMSRMISKYNALGQHNQVRRVYRTAQALYLGLGAVCTTLMMVFCNQLAAFQQQPDAAASLLCLAPCAVLMGMMSAYRGFFQGQGDMTPTSVSQVLEAVFKLAVGLAASWLIKKYTNSVALAAAGAILGVTLSCLFSAVFLRSRFAPAYRVLPQTQETPDSYGTTVKGLMAIAVPITIGSAGLQLLTVLETRVYMQQLLGSGLSQESADTMKGIYNMCQTIFNMPTAFIVPITVSVLPAITSYMTVGDGKNLKATEESAARVTGLLAAPCAVGLFVLAEPVVSLLGGYEGEKLVLAAALMRILAVGIYFYATVQYTNALLQAHGYAHIPVIHMLLCGAVKLAVVYVLTGNPNIGIAGAPVGAGLCYLFISLLNLLALRRRVPEKPALLINQLKPLLAAALMGALVFLCYWGLEQLGISSRILLCGLPILVGVAVYGVAAVLLKAITRADCLLLPKGDKLAKLLRL